MDVARSLGDAPRLGVLDRLARSIEPRCGKTGDLENEPTGGKPLRVPLCAEGIAWLDRSEMALLSSAEAP